MSRYIDANKIIICASEGISKDGLIFIPMRDVHKSIDNTTTADVVEVRHSKIKWVNRPIPAQCATVVDEYGKEHYGMIHGLIKNNPVGYCEECGKRLDDTFMNFCHNCGAKMDGERKEL